MSVKASFATASRFFLIFLCLVACTGENQKISENRRWKEPNGKLKVLCTIAMINDLVKVVGGEHVDCLTLIKGELDPHSYQLVKGDDEKFSLATVIFYNGLGLEHGPSLQNILQGNKKAVGLGNLLMQRYPERLLYDQGQKDPHIWMDVSLWAATLPYIVNGLADQDPQHAAMYQINAQRLKEKMMQAHQQILQLLHTVPEDKRYLVTSHDAFQYFARAYLATEKERHENSWQARCAAPEGLAPESQLSVSDIQNLLAHVARYHIQVLFPESNVSKDSIRKIVAAGKEKGLHLRMADQFLYADAMDPEGYLATVHYDAQVIANNLNAQDHGQ